MRPKERELLEAAVETVAGAVGIEIQVDWRAEVLGEPIVRLQTHGYTMELRAEVKDTLNPVVVAQVAEMFAEHPARWVLVTRYVTAAMARKLRELGIQFMDTAGNAYLNADGIHIYVQGEPLPERWKIRREPTALLGVAGLKVVFVLLCDPVLVSIPVRDIAGRAGVAVGTVAGTLKDLRNRGFLVDRPGANRRLVRLQDLLRLWTTAYAERLRPRTLYGRFTSRDPGFPDRVRLERFGAMWGGETAAAQWTGYLKPEVHTLYAIRPFGPLLVALKLVQDDRGLLEVRERFWNTPPVPGQVDAVHPILVYADLLATDSARNTEAARLIYRERIQEDLTGD